MSVSSVQYLSCVRVFETPWTEARQASLSITKSQSLPKLMSIESVMPSNHLILYHPLLLPPSIFPSLRVFSSESVYQRTNTSSPPAIEQTGWLLCCSVFSLFFILYWSIVDLLPSWPSGKEFTCNAWDLGSIPGLTRVGFPWGGNGNPLQYSCLGNPMDRGAWWAIVYRVTKSWTQLKRLNQHCHS